MADRLASRIAPGPAGADLATTVTVKNTSASAVAFLLRADVRRGTASGGLLSGDNELQSSIWQNNDITLFPGESQTLTVTYDSSGRVINVIALEVCDGVVQSVMSVVNPDKLRHIGPVSDVALLPPWT